MNNARGSCTYPRNGFWTINDAYGYGAATVYKISDRCKTPQETIQRTNFDDQLRGMYEGGGSGIFDTKWLYGIDFIRHPNSSQCQISSTVDIYTDVKFDWQPYDRWYTANGHGNYGGLTTSLLGNSSYCASFGKTHPCGFHISTIELNLYRFDNVYSDSYGGDVLSHEVGHSMGFADYCEGTFNSISRNGNSGCSTGFGSYSGLDRTRLSDLIYKNRS